MTNLRTSSKNQITPGVHQSKWTFTIKRKLSQITSKSRIKRMREWNSREKAPPALTHACILNKIRKSQTWIWIELTRSPRRSSSTKIKQFPRGSNWVRFNSSSKTSPQRICNLSSICPSLSQFKKLKEFCQIDYNQRKLSRIRKVYFTQAHHN